MINHTSTSRNIGFALVMVSALVLLMTLFRGRVDRAGNVVEDQLDPLSTEIHEETTGTGRTSAGALQPIESTPYDASATSGPAESVSLTADLHLRVRRADGSRVAGLRGVLVRRVSSFFQELQTDSNGDACLERLDPGRYRLRLSTGASRRVALRPGETARVEMLVPRGTRWSVVVESLKKEPIRGAVVYLTGHSGDVPIRLGETDPNGTLQIGESVPYSRIQVRARGYAPSATVFLQDTAQDQGDVVIRLAPEAWLLSGTVKSELGEPIRNARVIFETGLAEPVMRDDGLLSETCRELIALSDEDGTFELSLAGAEDAALHVEHPDFVSWSGTAVNVEGTARLSVVLRTGATVFGVVRVVETEIGPEAITVRASGPGGTKVGVADGKGRFVLNGVAAGRVVLTASHRRYGVARKEAVVSAGERLHWDCVLEPGIVARVKVLQGQSPLGGWLVRIEQKESEGRRKGRGTRTDDEGVAVFANCMAGPFCIKLLDEQAPIDRIAAEVKGALPCGEVIIAIDEGSLPRGGITGRILSKDATRARHVSVQSQDAGQTSVLVEVGGVFHVDGLAPGVYRLEVCEGDRVVLWIGPVEVQGDRVTHIGTYSVPTPGRLRFVSTRGEFDEVRLEMSGRLIAGWLQIWVRLHSTEWIRPDVAPGDYTVRVIRGGDVEERTVRVGPGETVVVTLP